MKRYKEIILYDEDMSKYTKDKALSSEEEGWEFIYQDLLFAAQNLPDRTTSKGRADKGMAWAFMTRAMLYAERYDDIADFLNGDLSQGNGTRDKIVNCDLVNFWSSRKNLRISPIIIGTA